MREIIAVCFFRIPLGDSQDFMTRKCHLLTSIKIDLSWAFVTARKLAVDYARRRIDDVMRSSAVQVWIH